MTTVQPALDRALSVMRSNRYLALATLDDDGPWVAALAFVLGPPSCLYFFSQTTSRHGKALTSGSKVAGLIYDSTLPSEKVESIQFSGHGEPVHNRDQIAGILSLAARRDGTPSPSDQQIDDHHKNRAAIFYKITIDKAYVLDQRLFAESGIDAREGFDAEELFQVLLK